MNYRLPQGSSKWILVVACAAVLSLALLLHPVAGNWGARVSPRPTEFQLAYERELAAHQARMDRAYQHFAVDWLLLGDSQLQAFPSALLSGTVVNFAIGGETMGRLAVRMNRYALLGTAKSIVLGAGSNDLREGMDADTIQTAWQRAISQVPPARAVVCLGLFPRREIRSDQQQWRITINQRISAACAAQGGRFIDPYALLADHDSRLRAEFDDGDGVHLNGAGYRVLAEALGRAASPAGSSL